MRIVNFGRNLRFVPREIHAPQTETELLALLDRCADRKVRVAGSRHSWSEAIVTDDVFVDMKHFDSVAIERNEEGEVWAVVGGGCQIKHLLTNLHALSEYTLPTLGLITEQTIAGAISTGTHGSGRPSLSHFIASVRLAAYDHGTDKSRMFDVTEGDALRGARCGLGALGVIVSVRFRCVPQYSVAEVLRQYDSIDAILELADTYPLQQFYLIPHSWKYFAQHRRIMPVRTRNRTWLAWWYRQFWFWGLDVGLHLTMLLIVRVLRSAVCLRAYYRHVLPWLILQNHEVVDDSDQMLVMEHELFVHIEIEIFVASSQVRSAAGFVRQVVSTFDGSQDSLSPENRDRLDQIGLLSTLEKLKGTFHHHYAITFRKVLPDETLISMTADASEPWYAISFISYDRPRDAFLAMADFLARGMTALFQARLHWGKYFPLDATDTETLYPHLAEFRNLCRRFDPRGVFRNAYVDRVIGFEPGVSLTTATAEAEQD